MSPVTRFVVRTQMLACALTLGFFPSFGQSKEKESPIQTSLQRELAKFDRNKDGKLDAEEQQAYLAAEEKKSADQLKEWDKNGDGKLDEEERAAARAIAEQAAAAARRAEKKANSKKQDAASSTSKP